MKFDAETLGLSDTAFNLLRDLIHQRTGLFYDNNKQEILADKLSARVVECGFHSFLDYYYFLKYDPAAATEWPRIMDALSVQETYFWREMDQVRALVDVLVPQYFAAGQRDPLRIWSAACATGEEPLSIAMALHEAGWLARAPIEIYGSDASPVAIQKAQRGLYRERSFRALPAELRARYFTAEEEGWRIAAHLHSRVRWAVVNLLAEDEIAPFASSPVIFCRNVFIYFSPEATCRVVRAFYERMPSPGYLFIAAAESLLRLNTGFELQQIGGAFAYVKQ